jgi:DNA-binding MarR family transcriptional regulator
MDIKLDYAIQYMKIIVDNMQKMVNRMLQQYDLTFSQLRLLMIVYASGQESCTMKELEQALQISQQTVAGTVRRLEDKDYILALPDSNDKRVKRVTLTESGRDIVKTARGKVIEVNFEILKPLSADEQKELTDLLRKIFLHISQDDNWYSDLFACE